MFFFPIMSVFKKFSFCIFSLFYTLKFFPPFSLSQIFKCCEFCHFFSLSLNIVSSRPRERQVPGRGRLPSSRPLDELRGPQKAHPTAAPSSSPAPAPAGERVVSPRHGQPKPQRRLRPPRLPESRGRGRRLGGSRKRRRARGRRGEKGRLRRRALVVCDERRGAQRGRGGLERPDERDHRRVPRPRRRRRARP